MDLPQRLLHVLQGQLCYKKSGNMNTHLTTSRQAQIDCKHNNVRLHSAKLLIMHMKQEYEKVNVYYIHWQLLD